MARPKKEKEDIAADTPVEASTEPVVTFETKSQAYLAFQSHIENYAKLNPTKYELKKEALINKLNTL